MEGLRKAQQDAKSLLQHCLESARKYGLAAGTAAEDDDRLNAVLNNDANKTLWNASKKISKAIALLDREIAEQEALMTVDGAAARNTDTVQ